jgi:hypothetical protein
MSMVESERDCLTAPSGLALKHSVYAAVDLGTNNCRLLVARPTDGGFRVIDAFSRVVRLGEGLAASGILSESAMRRTLDLRLEDAPSWRHHRARRSHRGLPARGELRRVPRPHAPRHRHSP